VARSVSVALLLVAGCGGAGRPPDPDPHLPPLLDAARRGDLRAIRERLDSGGSVEERDDHGRTALHWAAIGGSREAGSLLLDRGADVAAPAQLKMTPLHWAALAGQAEVADLLLRRGAEVLARNAYGMTPLHEAGGPEVARVLLDRGARVADRDDRGMTPLHLARNGKVARVLLEAGADPFARSASGRRPMDMAAAWDGEKARVAIYAVRAPVRLRGEMAAVALELRNLSSSPTGPLAVSAESPACEVAAAPARLPRLDPGQAFPVLLSLARRPGVVSGEHPLRLRVAEAGSRPLELELRVDAAPGETPEDRGLVRVGGATLRPGSSRLWLLAFAAVPLLLSALWLLARRRRPPASGPGA